jgi:hypothetical protein
MRRNDHDRRRRPTGPLDALLIPGRRTQVSRAADRHDVHFFDRFEAVELAFIVSILGLTIVDGVLTLELLGVNCEEANPLMKYVLHQGHGTFFVVKYSLTALGLPFLLVFKNHYLFGTRFRVGYTFPFFLVLYVVLVSYETWLFQTHQLRIDRRVGVLQGSAATMERGRSSELLQPCWIYGDLPDPAIFTARREMALHRPAEASAGLE